MKKGFTLFELLLTLAIVGTVAALTIPTVVDNYTKTTYIRSLQNVQNSLKTAITDAFTKERVSTLEDSTLGSSAENFLRRYIKISANCGTSHANCLASSYKSLDKSTSINTSSMLDDNFYCITVQSGAVICLTKMSPNNGDDHGNSVVVIDINGKNQPNLNGRDFFSFNIYTDGKMGNSYETVLDDANGTTCNNYASTAGFGGACYSRIVADGWKMNY